MHLYAWAALILLVLLGELFVGGFYLVIVAGCLLLGALANLVFTLPLLDSFAVSLTLAVVVLLGYAKFKPSSNASNEVDCLDAGQPVQVTTVGSDGTSQVSYRGALWQAKAESGDLTEGSWIIRKKEGNLLILQKA